MGKASAAAKRKAIEAKRKARTKICNTCLKETTNHYPYKRGLVRCRDCHERNATKPNDPIPLRKVG